MPIRDQQVGPWRFDASTPDVETFEIGTKQYSVREAIAKGWYIRNAAGHLVIQTAGTSAGAPVIAN